MVTTTRSVSTTFTVLVLGKSTSIPDCSSGAVTIKITRSTSITSTKGVTLISAIDVWVVPLGVVKAIFNLTDHVAHALWPETKVREQRCRRFRRSAASYVKYLSV